MTTAYGVFRVLKDGRQVYISRSVTHSQKLAEDIAKGLTRGEVTMPDGRIKQVRAFPHIAKELGTDTDKEV